MKPIRVASISLSAMVILTVCANAQQATTTVSEVPKLQPGTFPHPDTSADVLGIRIGMTVSQADAIAEKIYGKPQDVERDQDTFTYRDVSVRSHPYVLTENYDKSMAHGGTDSLFLYFLGPASGNRLFAISRFITFNDMQGFDPKKALLDPSISALKASLVKKYGPPSSDPRKGMSVVVWAFTQRSRLSGIADNDLSSYTNAIGRKPTHFNGQVSGGSECDTPPGHPTFFAMASIYVNGHDRSKADNLTVGLSDPLACVNGVNESIKQLKSDAMKAYKSALAKAPAAPKL